MRYAALCKGLRQIGNQFSMFMTVEGAFDSFPTATRMHLPIAGTMGCVQESFVHNKIFSFFPSII